MATYLPGVTDIFPEPSLFTPNFNYMDQMLRRREAMYEQGFAQVNSAYNFVNRAVTNPESQQVRDRFLNQARLNLKNLSAMDLSQPQNVLAAKSVFEPFVKNQDVLGDMALTSHWDQQESIAESYRTKDGGKEYSEDNANYVRMQRAQFAQDKLGSWKNYYANRRYYTPYYDWNKEFKEWFSSFKPNKISIDRTQGLYKITEEQGGATAQDLKEFFNGVASEKARNQMRIEASVRYASNPEALAMTYANIAKKDVSTYNYNINLLDSKIKLSKDPNERKMLSEQKKALLDQRDDLNRDIEKIKNGDIDFVRANAEKIAFGIYYDENISRLAKGLSWNEYKRSIGADEVALAQWKDAQQWARDRMKEDRADRRELMKLQGLPGMSGNFVTFTAGEGDVIPKETLGGIQAEIDKIELDRKQAADKLTDIVARGLGKLPSQVTAADISAYTTSPLGQRDKNYIDYQMTMSALDVKKDMVERKMAAAKKYADDNTIKETQAAYDEYTQKVKNLTTSSFTRDEIFNAVKNGNYLKKESAPVWSGFGTAGIPITTTMDFVINGKKVTRNSPDYQVISTMINRAESALGNVRNSYGNYIQKYFGDNAVVNQRGRPIPQGTPDFKRMAGLFGSLSGVEDGTITELYYGGKNDFYVNVKESTPEKLKELSDKLLLRGLDSKYDKAKGLVYVKDKPGFSKLDIGLDLYKDLTPMERDLVGILETEAGDGYQSPFFYAGNLTVDKKNNPLPRYRIDVSVIGNEKVFYLYIDGKETPLAVEKSAKEAIDGARMTSQAFIQDGKGYSK